MLLGKNYLNSVPLGLNLSTQSMKLYLLDGQNLVPQSLIITKWVILIALLTMLLTNLLIRHVLQLCYKKILIKMCLYLHLI